MPSNILRVRLAVVVPVLVLLGAAPAIAAPPPPSPPAAIPDSAPQAAVLRSRNALRRLVELARSRPELFPERAPKPPRILPEAQREEVRSFWAAFWDHLCALDGLGRMADEAASRETGEAAREARLVAHAAFVAGYRWGFEWLEVADGDPAVVALLDEEIPSAGLPAGTWHDLGHRFRSLARGTEFAARVLVRSLPKGAAGPFVDAVRDDEKALWKVGAGKGEIRTIGQAFRLLGRAGSTAWMPVQTGVANFMGDTKVKRIGRSLVSTGQARALATRLEPADLLLTRHEWYLSNVGLPGFWPHAALWVGTPEQRSAFFDTPEVRDWLLAQGVPGGRFETWLERQNPLEYRRSLALDEGRVRTVLEAIGEGTLFRPIEVTAECDSLAALRPRRSRVEAAIALGRAFKMAGRPYDYEFDFRTDSALVCSELVVKAWEPADGMKGLVFPLLSIVGRLATPPNEMIKVFDAEAEREDRQLDFVAFLDGQEKAGRADEADETALRDSWKRPKWHVLTQDSPGEGKATGK